MSFKHFVPLTSLALAVALGSQTAAAAASSTLPQDTPVGHLEQVFAFPAAMPTGVTVSEQGRLFVNFPRWGDDVPFTVGELRDGKVVPYPDLAINQANAEHPEKGLISVQSVVADGLGHVWILDTAAPQFSEPVTGGAKLIAVDLKTNKVVKTVVFPKNVILPSTYVNDVRFDFSAGKEGVAYVTDSSLSGPGAIIVLDLATGTAVRRLNGAASTSADPGFVPRVEGQVLKIRGADGSTKPFAVAADGIALSADRQTLYFCPLSSRHLFSVPTALLRDPKATEQQLAAAVQDLGEKGPSDGLEADSQGAVYAGDYEDNSIRKRLADGSWQTIVHDPRVLWPDTLSVGADGYLYFIANQLHRQALFHGGKDLREKPYSLMRVKIDAKPVQTR
ncbi:L-dopachrome tautomerase-related protein [Pseudomonas sp. LY10J]|uniref:Gluconolaconase n=1 Tax=Pseudomonas quercus TaxID=2722792 RepID=A0ABX0YM03_9PSED|nr:gluconolaconase [Pseudomonas sp. LY10J]NJP03309.1 gluconolaconase [Pseudomonas quercus]